ncbi:hypothetical protein BH10CYA1_BH10CYA1_40440 [soil metagenome]
MTKSRVFMISVRTWGLVQKSSASMISARKLVKSEKHIHLCVISGKVCRDLWARELFEEMAQAASNGYLKVRVFPVASKRV